MTPGSSGTSAIHRPSSSCSRSILSFMPCPGENRLDRSRPMWRSYHAELDRLVQAGQGVADRDELVGHEALEADAGDGPGDGLVVQLLGLVELVAARVAAGVVVAEGVVVLLDRADHVAFHDLHVVDVIEQLEVV